MATVDSRIRLDLNSPEFQDVFLALQPDELRQVVAALRRLRELDWNGLDRHTGFRWEAVEHLKAPNGAKVYSLIQVTAAVSSRARQRAYGSLKAQSSKFNDTSATR